MLLLSTVLQQKYFCFPIRAAHGAAMVVCSSSFFFMKSRKGLAHDVMYTAVLRADLVYDVTVLVKMTVLLSMFSWLAGVDFERL